jgi:hypothetical protein
VTKKATEETLTGERGIAMIASAVAAMKHIWRAAPGATDFGIDGDIELRDPTTGEVRNVRIGVQSRATTKPWPGETSRSFHYVPSHADLKYWLSSNQPVILVCSRHPEEIYWRSVHDWARDPLARAARRVDFDKERDRFDASARDLLFTLKSDIDGRAEPPGPDPTPETVRLNLMPVQWVSPRLYSAEVGGRSRGELFRIAGEQKVTDFAAVLRDGYLWSLAPFREGFLAAIDAGDSKDGPLAPWLESTQASDLDLMRELVRRAVLSANHNWIAWHSGKDIAYFRLRTPADEWRPRVYRWTKGPGRTVVAPQEAKKRDGYTGYRHDAAEIAIRKLGAGWYVEVHPTYLFTWDGVKVSRHHASALKKIKELETHPAVSQALRMWEHLLKERMTLDDRQDEPLALGALVSATAPVGIADSTWRPVTPAELGYSHDPDALTLFDPDRLEDESV